MINLSKATTRRKKRIGRGYGSGKGGHTSGRGQKGQKSRKSLGVLFEGVKVKKSLIKRLPLRRGKGKFHSKKKPLIIKTDYLNIIPSGTLVNLETLIKYNIVNKGEAEEFGVKILGNARVAKKLTISIPISRSAAKDVEKAGGKVLLVNSKLNAQKSKN